MTRDEVIALARQAGAAKFVHERAGEAVEDPTNMLVSVSFLERFAHLVATQQAGIDPRQRSQI